MWRFWRALPPKGKIGMFFGSWYTAPILDRAFRRTKKSDLERSVQSIVRFEKMLADEGALVVKLWFHLAKEVQERRLKALQKDPRTRWRVTETDWRHFESYDRLRKVSEQTLRETSSAESPWIVIEGADPRYRNLKAGRALAELLRARLDRPEKAATLATPLPPRVSDLNLLRSLDLTKKLPKTTYARRLEELQGRLALLTRDPRFRNRRVVVVFEGMDAAGKGGAIRRITSALDVRIWRVVPVAAPTEEERAQPYLWRFWRQIPPKGRLTVFDRSWYGRVLVERVEGFCSEADWLRAYSEINDFEEQLVKDGTVLVKFWLQVSPKVQLERFRERERTSFKRFKITDEDWRNRKKWPDYEVAACDTFERTGPGHAPWTLVEADDKPFARVKILETLVAAIEKQL
jgi:AMP-polyphosphate phosphotransferase